MTDATSISWTDLRSWNGSQQLAFEELCCQLHSSTSPAPGSTFIRKGKRDAGVEGYWQLPDGSEHGIQAKFFRGSPDESQLAQVDRSVETALTKHSKLTKYTVCLATDRDNPRIDGQSDFMQRWGTHLAKWERSASDRGREVDFVYCGESELCKMLAYESNAGLAKFWFGKEELSPTWFVKRKDESIARLLQSRYLPQLHVDISDLDHCVRGLVHDSSYFMDIAAKCTLLTKAVRATADWLDLHSSEVLKQLSQIVTTLPVSNESDCIDRASLQVILREAESKCSHLLQAELPACWSRWENDYSAKHEDEKQWRRRSQRIQEIEAACEALRFSVCDERGQAARSSVLLISGEAGIGKSHYVANLVQQRVSENFPALLFHGEHFRSGPILPQICERLGVLCSGDEFLGALSAVARARRCRALLAIDATNEAEDKKFWKRELPPFLAAVARHPDVTVVLSIRTTYDKYCLPDNLASWNVQRITHPGFAGVEETAFLRYFKEYAVTPTSPVLQPEFSNPLFLKTFCESVSADPSQMAAAQSSLRSLLNLYQQAINNRLAEDVLGCDPSDRPVQCAIQALADSMAQNGRRVLVKRDARVIVDAVHSSSDFQKSLFRHLLHEGIISESVFGNEDNDPVEYVRFAYERFGDFWLAEALLRRLSKTADEADSPSAPDGNVDIDGGAESLQSMNSQVSEALSKMLPQIADDEARYHNEALIESLSILIAEHYGLELTDLVDDVMSSAPMTQALLRGIPWRSASTLSESIEGFIHECLLDERYRFETLDCLLRVATRPDHRLNANWLHHWLIGQPMAERDAKWSTYLHIRWKSDSLLKRIVEWSWSQHDHSFADARSRKQCGICLAWFFTSSNRFLRDRATKALVALFDSAAEEFVGVLEQFREVDDLYVSERVYAAACGLTLRSADSSVVTSIAQKVFEFVFAAGMPPAHILLREYARLVVERATFLNPFESFNVAKIRPPFHSTIQFDARPWDVIREDHKDRGFGELILSLWPNSGDFARYVLGSGSQSGAHAWSRDREKLRAATSRGDPDNSVDWSNLENLLAEMDATVPQMPNDDELMALAAENQNNVVKEIDEERACYLESDLACRWIFERVLQLGWTVERFGAFDAQIDEASRSAHKAERIGKKYQWIAYHEWLAHVTDQRPYRSSWHKVFQYEGTWELHVRDIDPTCLLTSTARNSNLNEQRDPVWWASLEHKDWKLDIRDTLWLKGAEDLPEIEPLLLSTAPDTGTRYVALQAYATWESPLAPGKQRYDEPFRRIWYIQQGYLLRRADQQAFVDWAARQDFNGRWMPESHDTYGLFTREFFWAPAYVALDRADRTDATLTRETFRGNTLPCEVVVPTTRFVAEGTGFDCSLDESVSYHSPGIHLAEEMMLNCGQMTGTFVDENANVVAFDPSIHSPGPSTLLMEQAVLSEFLDRKGYSLVWTILGGKQTCIPSMMDIGRATGELQLNGVAAFDSGSVKGTMSAHFQPFHDSTSVREHIRTWDV